MLEWSRKQDGGILLDDGGGRLSMQLDVVGQATPSELVPKSIGLVRIMVTRQQMPVHRGVSTHSLNDLVARVRRGGCVVVNIARNQYMAHVVLAGEFADARDRLQSCQLEATHLHPINEAENFADLPVGRMNETECHWLDSFPKYAATGAHSMESASPMQDTLEPYLWNGLYLTRGGLSKPVLDFAYPGEPFSYLGQYNRIRNGARSITGLADPGAHASPGGTIVSLHASPLPLLTEEIAITSIREFFADKPFVFFGTGMSCALDTRFGMPSLKDELSVNVVPDPEDSEQVRQWNMVMESLQNGNDLETALNNVVDSTLLGKIMSATGRLISSIDREYALQISNCEVTWPATAFFKRVVDTLPESDRVLHVLTPNYDTLFEHACE